MQLFFWDDQVVWKVGEIAGLGRTEVAELLSQRHLPYGTPVLLDDLMRPVEPLSSWFRSLALDGRKPKTMRTYAYAVLRFLEYLLARGLDLRLATESDVREFRVWRRERGKATVQGATWDKESAAISELYTYLSRTGYVAGRPWRSSATLTEGVTRDLRVRHLELDQYIYLRDVGFGGLSPAACLDESFHGWQPHRNRASCELALLTGMRVQEWSALLTVELGVDAGQRPLTAGIDLAACAKRRHHPRRSRPPRPPIDRAGRTRRSGRRAGIPACPGATPAAHAMSSTPTKNPSQRNRHPVDSSSSRPTAALPPRLHRGHRDALEPGHASPGSGSTPSATPPTPQTAAVPAADSLRTTIDSDDTMIDVSPAYLAGREFSNAPFERLVELWGWGHSNAPELSQSFGWSPDHRFRLADGQLDPGAWWHIAASRDPLAPPQWQLAFSKETPPEFVTAATEPLARTGSRIDWTGEDHPALKPPTDRRALIRTLQDAGWHSTYRDGLLDMEAPDRLARVQVRLDPPGDALDLMSQPFLGQFKSVS